MRPDQRAAAMAIVRASLSDRGAGEVGSVIALETVLGTLEREAGRPGWQRRDPGLYWFAVFGEPGGRGPWSWRVGGHHVAIHLTFAGGRVAGSTPSFLGANPAIVPHGPTAGSRALSGEEELARRLLAGLERRRSTTGGRRRRCARRHPERERPTCPRRLDPHRCPPRRARRGRSRGPRAARAALRRSGPARRSRRPIGTGSDRRVSTTSTFAWAGPDQPDRGHYYAVRGPGFLIEYDNTQDGANDIHAVRRDLANDWGEDLLARHYAAGHPSEAQP